MFIVCCLVWFGFGWLVVVDCACCVSCLICLLGCSLGVGGGVGVGVAFDWLLCVVFGFAMGGSLLCDCSGFGWCVC